MEVTLVGISRATSALQYWNARLPIDLILVGNVIDVNDEHDQKAFLSSSK